MSIIPVELQQSRVVGVPRDSLPTVRASLNPAPPNAGDFRSTLLSTVADRVVQRYCQIRRSHPGLWQNPVDVAGNALLANAPNMFAEELCRPYDNAEPNTGAPESQVVGGQCLVNYVVGWTTQQVNGSTAGNGSVVLPGPIRSVRMVVGTSGLFRTWRINIVYGPTSLLYNIEVFSTQTVSSYMGSWQYTITRQDGLPDNCGNAPPVPLPPTPPQWDTTITIPVGNQIINVPISIGGPNRGNYPNFVFDPTVTIDGAVRVQIGPSEVQIIYPAPIRGFPDSLFRDINPNVNLAPALSVLSGNQIEINAGVEIIQGEIVDGIPVDLSPIEQLIRACCCSPEYRYSTELITGGTRGGIFDLPEGTVAVLVSQTVSPVRSPGQSGEGIVPDARWEGWISFGRDGKPGVRCQLQWREGGFPVPPDSNCVLIFGLYNSSYSVTAVIKTKEIPE